MWPQFPWGSLIPVGVLSAFVSVALGETLGVYFRPHSPRVGIDVFLDLESVSLSRPRHFLLLQFRCRLPASIYRGKLSFLELAGLHIDS